MRRRQSRLRSPRRWLNLPAPSTGNARRTLAAYPVEAEILASFRSARRPTARDRHFCIRQGNHPRSCPKWMRTLPHASKRGQCSLHLQHPTNRFYSALRKSRDRVILRARNQSARRSILATPTWTANECAQVAFGAPRRRERSAASWLTTGPTCALAESTSLPDSRPMATPAAAVGP